MKEFFKKYQIYIFILFFSILIVWLDFFFKSWTYFLLDMVFSPTTVWKWFFEQSIYWHLFNFFNYILWYIFFSKIYFFLIVFFTWILAYKLSQIFIKIFSIDKKYKNFFSYTFILFLYLNPFFYERMITQPWVFTWIVFIWFWIYFLLKNIFFEQKVINYIYLWILFWFSFTVMNHALFMVALIYLLYFLFFIRNKKSFFYLLLSWIIFISLNLNWIIWNIFLWQWETLSYVNSLNQANIENFYTNWLSPLWPVLTSLQLYGFWWERYFHFKLPDSVNPNWFMAWFVVLWLIVFWIYKYIKINKERKILYFLLILWFISYILALGINAPWGFISQFLYDYVPFYVWLREPHKWIWILMLVYAIFFSIWVYYILLILEKIYKSDYTKYIVLFVLFIFLNSWTPNVILAFSGQLFMTDYPKDYVEFRNTEIQKDYKNNQYLLFPWHSYIACDRSKRVTSNIFKNFSYPLKIISSDNIEVWNLYTNSSNPRSKDIEKFIETKDIDLLKKHNITHIIQFDTCADHEKFQEILDNLQKDNKIKKIKDGKDIDLYEIINN